MFNHFSLDRYQVLFILLTYSLKNNRLKIDVFTLRQNGIYLSLETSDITSHSPDITSHSLCGISGYISTCNSNLIMEGPGSATIK